MVQVVLVASARGLVGYVVSAVNSITKWPVGCKWTRRSVAHRLLACLPECQQEGMHHGRDESRERRDGSIICTPEESTPAPSVRPHPRPQPCRPISTPTASPCPLRARHPPHANAQAGRPTSTSHTAPLPSARACPLTYPEVHEQAQCRRKAQGIAGSSRNTIHIRSARVIPAATDHARFRMAVHCSIGRCLRRRRRRRRRLWRVTDRRGTKLENRDV